ncbi:MmgE/PrpD family protein [Caballeronia udeis]|uniref:MmgE/PrpD family protein n=1 Tax=Caballeronia udeis TaxID=1232866 RepID=A0A158I4I6_9BURK|nr:MmgE/PrpD family protein [Caballeronia udeis]SAL51456.1 MmgE/PrpD family protein [Caballeronia udeis]
MNSKTIAEQFSEYASSLHYEDLPDEVVHRAKCLIIDTLGCALGGYASDPVRIARELAANVTSKEPASLLCSGEKTSLDLAVFVNGVMIRYLDFNDGYTGKEAGHPSDSIAALISTGEVMHADGRALITATVVAYEIFCRMCDTLNIKPMGFDHVTLGAMASVTGAARLLGLTPEQITQAVNLTVAANVALYQTRIGNVSMWKGCAYANASRNAIFAAQLAKRGMTGPSPVFEGRAGYFTAVSRQPFELAPFGGGNQPFKIMECLIKKYPLGQYSQSVVEAALLVRERIRSVRDIVEVHIHTLETAVSMMAGDPEKWRPSNRESADHSMPYAAAVALMHGRVDRTHFEDPYLHDPELLELVSRIRCSVSEEANRREPEAMLCDLDLTLADGRCEAVRVEYHRGHPRNPMSNDEVEGKFRRLADGALTKRQSDMLLSQLWKLDELADVGDLFALARID